MALIGVYNFTPMLGEVLHDIPIDLWISDVDLYLREAIEPLLALRDRVESGQLNLLVGREMYLQYMEEMDQNCMYFSGAMTWKNFIDSPGISHYDFFEVGEGPFWEVVAANVVPGDREIWDEAVRCGDGALFADWLSTRADFVALIENGLCYVFRSDRTEGRDPVGSSYLANPMYTHSQCAEEGDADKPGDYLTYLLPEWVEDEAAGLLEEQAVAVAIETGHDPTPEFVARYTRNEYGEAL